jgi:hypothetical protein
MTGLADVTKTKLAADFGAATAGTTGTLQDVGKAWRVNHWANFLLELVKAQSGMSYFSLISANTADTLTFSALPVTVSPGDVYFIRETSSPTSANLIRWGRNVTPTWVHAAEQIAPGALTVLVTQAVTAGLSGFIYGFFVSVGEGNDFLINWTSATVAYSKRLVFGGGGVIQAVEGTPMNEGLPADGGTNVTITNVNAGGAGIVYQANILYAEA